MSYLTLVSHACLDYKTKSNGSERMLIANLLSTTSLWFHSLVKNEKIIHITFGVLEGFP